MCHHALKQLKNMYYLSKCVVMGEKNLTQYFPLWTKRSFPFNFIVLNWSVKREEKRPPVMKELLRTLLQTIVFYLNLLLVAASLESTGAFLRVRTEPSHIGPLGWRQWWVFICSSVTSVQNNEPANGGVFYSGMQHLWEQLHGNSGRCPRTAWRRGSFLSPLEFLFISLLQWVWLPLSSLLSLFQNSFCLFFLFF